MCKHAHHSDEAVLEQGTKSLLRPSLTWERWERGIPVQELKQDLIHSVSR